MAPTRNSQGKIHHPSLDSRPLIDSHVHVMSPKRVASGIRWLKQGFRIPRGEGAIADEPSEAELIAGLERAGIVQWFNFFHAIFPNTARACNRFQYEFSRREPRAIGFGTVHPGDDDPLAVVDEALGDFKLTGIKIHPHIERFSLLDLRMAPVHERLNQLGRPLMCHTGHDDWYGWSLPYEELREVLTRYAYLPVVILHLFAPCFRECFQLLEDFPQCYADGANAFAGVVMPYEDGRTGFMGYTHDSVEPLERFSDRSMWGTDYPMIVEPIERLLAYFRGLGLSPPAERDILYNTAYRFIEWFAPERLLATTPAPDQGMRPPRGYPV